jgi:hypothetical protein
MMHGIEKIEEGQIRRKIESIHSIIKRTALPNGNFLITRLREDGYVEYIDSCGMTCSSPIDFVYQFTEIVK